MYRSSSLKRSRSGSFGSSQSTVLDRVPSRRGIPRPLRRASSVSKASIKQVVKSVLDRSRESKEFTGQQSLAPGVLQPTIVSIAGNYFAVSPASGSGALNTVVIPQGTDNGQRIGNRVSTKKLIHSFTLTPAAFNATTNPNPIPYIIRLYWFKRKGQTTTPPSLAQLVGSASGDFFEGGATSGGFTGDIMDYNRHMNMDDYTYLMHKTYKLGPALNTQQPSANYANSANNDYSATIYDRVDLTKFCPKTIQYDDDDNVNVGTIWCVCQLVAHTGATVSAAILPVSWKNEVFYQYTDM